MEKFNINIEKEDTTCPNCNHKNKRFWLAFYCGETAFVCRDCWYHEII